MRDQYVGLSQGRVIYLLPGVVGVQRGVAHQSRPAQCPRSPEGQGRGLELLSGLGDEPHLRWHDDCDSCTALGALSSTLSPGVCQGVARACRVGESVQISETSSRSQEGATRTDRLSKWKARLNCQAPGTKITMLKGLARRVQSCTAKRRRVGSLRQRITSARSRAERVQYCASSSWLGSSGRITDDV